MVSIGAAAGARVVVVLTVLFVVEVDSGVVEEVAAGLCLRRTSVTAKIAPLASMGGVVVGVVLVRGSVVAVCWAASISSNSALLKSSSSSSSCCSRASCSRIPSSHSRSSEVSVVELDMASSSLILGGIVAVGRCSR